MNLLCGILSIYFLYNESIFFLPSLFVVLGAIFDFFDGMSARALKINSNIGKELDSLADIVTFGVAPSLITISLLKDFHSSCLIFENFLVYIPLLIALLSAYRLAKFNIDSRQTNSFIGLPTPANALFWISLPIISNIEKTSLYLWGIPFKELYSFMDKALINPYTIIILSLFMSILLVANLPLFSLKFKNLSWKENKDKFIFLIISLLLIIALNFFAIPIIIIVYIIESLIINITKK
jgi:CDP-diacylglycerol--serine O-phosphatidyltransferase